MIIAGIPAYNESKHITQIVTETKLYVNMVIVVNDGSTDNTEELATQAGAIVLSHNRNYGVGASENTIMETARMLMDKNDYLITLDGDGQHFPSDIPKMISRIKKGDVDFVNGSRLYNKRKARPTPYRRVLNGIATYMDRFFSGYHSTDSQSGFKAYNYRIVMGLNYKCMDYSWNSEGYIRLHKLRARMGEVEVRTIWTPPKPDKIHATLSYGIKVLGRLFLIWIGIIK